MTFGLKIQGTGACLPKSSHLSSAFDRELGLPSGEVERLTGVVSRFYCDVDETQISIGIEAANRALADAGVVAADIDLIIGASAVPYQPIPATAPAYQAALGIKDGAAFSFDVNSTCLGFLTALECCDGVLRAGRYRRALIVSSEVASRGLPWGTRPDVAGLFGDGAAAAVVELVDTPGLVATLFETHASAYDACGIGAGGTRFDFHRQQPEFAANSIFEMDGKALFRLSSKHFTGFVDRLLAKAGWALDQVDCVIPHQASPAALAHITRQCGFNTDRVIDICQDHGNQIAASIPTALTHARDTNRLMRGDKVLMLGTSAGVSFGGIAMVY